MHEGFDRLEQVAHAAAKPTTAALIGLLIGTGLALVAALGPLVSAVTITVGVETQVGDAAGLPDASRPPWKVWARLRSSSSSPGGLAAACARGRWRSSS